MAEDLIVSLERLKQGMVDPSNQSIREKRWYDEPLPQQLGFSQPLDELIRGAAPRPNPQEGVEAVPYMSLADPFSMMVANKIMGEVLSFKGLQSNFTSTPANKKLGTRKVSATEKFIDYMQYIQQERYEK